MNRAGVCFAWSVVLVLAGCPGPDEEIDAGRDAGRDAGADVPADTASDTASADAPSDVPGDTGASCDGGGAVELCNAIDDDCNGIVDDGCACRPLAPVPVDDGFHLSLAVTSSGTIAVARQDFTTGALSVQRYSPAFVRLGEPPNLVIDDTRPANDLYLFALGEDVGGIWRQWPTLSEASDEVFFSRIGGLSGLRELLPASLTPGLTSLGHSVAALEGGGFVVARNHPSGPSPGLSVRLYDRDGVLTAGPHPIDDPARSVAYTGVGVIDGVIGVAFQAAVGAGPFDIRFARFGLDGMPLGAPIDVRAPGGVRPHLAAQPSGWGIVWEESAGIFFAAVAPDGTIAVAPRLVGAGAGAQGLSIAADGSGQWGIVHRHPSGGARFVQLDGDGEIAGEALLAGYSIDGLRSLGHDGGRYLAAVFGPNSALWIPCETR